MPTRYAAASTLIIISAHSRYFSIAEAKIIQAYFLAASLEQLLIFINIYRIKLSLNAQSCTERNCLALPHSGRQRYM